MEWACTISLIVYWMHMDNGIYTHVPVLTREVVTYMHMQPHGVYVDATFGGGGHTRALLTHESTASVIACDWDQHAIAQAQLLLAEFPERLQCVWANFARIAQALKEIDVLQVDGILADVGTSQFQIFNRPGFSVYRESELDMRMSPAHQKITAYELINKASSDKLADIFWTYGEERYARRIARAIVHARERRKFETTTQLARFIEGLLGRSERIHPATRVFQALRIFVNDELENIRAFLAQSVRIIRPGGRLVVISFHSLEDRVVKQFFVQHERAGLGRVIAQAVVPDEEEIMRNPASRSAKLRALEICSKAAAHNV